MGNKIIIDEEVLAKLDELINESENDFDKSLQNGERSKMHYAAARNSSYKKAKLLILENSTTISIDESIEDRAKKLINELNDYATMVDCYDYGLPIYDEHKLNLINIIKSFATEQSIISEIKSKEELNLFINQSNCEHNFIPIGIDKVCSLCGAKLIRTL